MQGFPPTSHSILERARDPNDKATWRKLVELYTPLLKRWVRPYLLQASEVDDIVQNVMTVLVSELPTFEHSQNPGAFRSWLRAITVNQLRKAFRSRHPRPMSENLAVQLSQLEDPCSSLSQQWDIEHDQYIIARLLESIRLEFNAASWRAFEATVREGRKTDEVAAELGVSENLVLIAKSRILKRLRQKAAGLIG